MAPELGDARDPFAVPAIKERDRRAKREAHHAREVVYLRRREAHLRAGGEGLAGEQAHVAGCCRVTFSAVHVVSRSHHHRSAPGGGDACATAGTRVEEVA
jgi:hypothetical protein